MKKGLLCFSLALILAWGGDAFGARTTRDLVFEDDDEAATQQESSGAQTIAAKATVVLERDGKTSTVAPNHEFKSGDKVKLVFTPNVDGYVYWLAKGSSGEYSMLFPNAKAGMDNAVKRNAEYTVPVKGGFRFDDTPGNEELLCILSPEKMPDLDKAASEQFANAGKRVADLEQEQTKKRAARDLVFEEEEDEDVRTNTQKAPAGEPFVASFVFKHN
ncbi:MAG: DUF4384 domain-containing protein [Desulfovibrio sp.]|nr:DUF4384 domain-containing protein [Desulfovibrio sp.]